MKRRIAVICGVFALIVVLVSLALTQVQLSAIRNPGKIETFLATQAKRFLISRDSRTGIPPAPDNRQANIEEGETLYGTECGMCHGADGHSLTDNGRWMYPRASDLTSDNVQQYSDRELFWIIKNGIRFSGMPGFAKTESDEHIWNLVSYIRTLRKEK
jgi:mono/diheme cytochrome c family protein